MRLVLLLAVALAARAQSVSIGAQTPNGRTLPKQAVIGLRDRTIVADHYCDMAEMEPGEIATCTVTLNQPARATAPTVVEITLPPSGFSAPPLLTIPAGARSATYRLTRVDTLATSGPQVMASAWSVWSAGRPAQMYAGVSVPCCARVDRCGLPTERVSLAPCRAP